MREIVATILAEANRLLPLTGVDTTPRGARLLYVAMTRAVQELALVTTGAPALPI